MPDYGIFEAASSDGLEQHNSRRQAERALDEAVFAAREQFGSFLGAATNKQDFEDRLALVKPELMSTVEAHLLPVTGVMRRVSRALRPDFRSKQAADYDEDWDTSSPDSREPDDEVEDPRGDDYMPNYQRDGSRRKQADDRGTDSDTGAIPAPDDMSADPAAGGGDPTPGADDGSADVQQSVARHRESGAVDDAPELIPKGDFDSYLDDVSDPDVEKIKTRNFEPADVPPLKAGREKTAVDAEGLDDATLLRMWQAMQDLFGTGAIPDSSVGDAAAVGAEMTRRGLASKKSESRRKQAGDDDVFITPESVVEDFKGWLEGRSADYDTYDEWMDTYEYADQVGESEDRAIVDYIDRTASRKTAGFQEWCEENDVDPEASGSYDQYAISQQKSSNKKIASGFSPEELDEMKGWAYSFGFVSDSMIDNLSAEDTIAIIKRDYPGGLIAWQQDASTSDADLPSEPNAEPNDLGADSGVPAGVPSGAF